jgi:uncharacterized protein (DUF302 family)
MYGFTTTPTGIKFDQALNRTIEARKGEEFGVPRGIDAQGVKKVKDKLGVEMPCNVIVREGAPERIVVGFLDPKIMVGMVCNPEVQAVADAAERLIPSACARLADNGAPARPV